MDPPQNHSPSLRKAIWNGNCPGAACCPPTMRGSLGPPRGRGPELPERERRLRPWAAAARRRRTHTVFMVED